MSSNSLLIELHNTSTSAQSEDSRRITDEQREVFGISLKRLFPK